MRTTKLIYFLLTAIVVFALLSGCGGGQTEAPPTEKPAAEEPPTEKPAAEEPPTKEPAPEEPPAEPVEITAWTFTYQPFVDGLTAMAEDFNASQSDYVVNVEVFDWGNYWDKIAAAVATGTGPDVFHAYTGYLGGYVSQGVLQSLPEDAYPLDEMAPMVLDGKIDGKLWAAPMGVRTFGYVYNPDYMEEAGVEPPKTWEEEIPVAEALTKFDEDGNLLVAGEYIGPHWEGYSQFQIRCYQAGGSPVSDDLRTATWDDPACIEAFEFLTSKATEHEIYIEGFLENSIAAFSQGGVGGFIAPSGVVGALQEQETPWAVAPFPAGPDNDATLGNFWPLVITQQAQDDKWDAALAFSQYATTPEANRIWARLTGDVPALLDVAAEDEFVNADYGTFVTVLPKAVYIFDPNSDQTRVGFDQAWDKVVLEGADPTEALLEGMPMAQQVFDEFWAAMDALP